MPTKVNQPQRDLIVSMRQAGAEWGEIGVALRLSPTTIEGQYYDEMNRKRARGLRQAEADRQAGRQRNG